MCKSYLITFIYLNYVQIVQFNSTLVYYVKKSKYSFNIHFLYPYMCLWSFFDSLDYEVFPFTLTEKDL